MTQVIFPVGRMVSGDLYKMFPRTDNFGKPKIGKTGQPEMQCNFGFAIAKGAETHWSQTEWGAEIFKIGKAAYPAEYASPSFAWKITDGDSSVPNKKGRAPNTNENYRGHWVIWFSQGWLPKLCNADGSQELVGHDAIVPGFYIRVMGDVKSNAPSPSPGVYINPSAVALIGEGDRIATEVNTSAFATAPAALPPGARPVTPAVAGFAPPVVPNPAFLQVPPPAPRPPVIPPARVMTPAAQGATYAQMIEAGWTDELLIQHGMMLA